MRQRAHVNQLIQQQNFIEQNIPKFRDNLSLLSKEINELKEIDALRSQEDKSLLVRIEALEEKPKTRSWPFGKK